MRSRTVLDIADGYGDVPGALLRPLVAQHICSPLTREAGLSQIALLLDSDGGLPRRRSLGSTAPLPGGTTTEVALQGEWDISGCAELSALLSRLIARRDTDILVDLSEMSFADTAVVRVLAVCQSLLERDEHRLTFRSPSRTITRLLCLFGLTDYIETRRQSQGP